MKPILNLGCALGVCLLSGAAAAQSGRPTIAVSEFTNQTSSAYWWGGDVGRQLSDALSNELSSTGDFNVVERQKLGAVIGEQDLASSGRVRQGSGPRTGNITGAHYLITGAVTSYTEDTSHTGGGLSFHGMSFGGGKSQAYIAIDLRVIDSETSEVVYSRTVEGNTTNTQVGIGGYLRDGLGGTFSQKKNTPAGKAVRGALVEASDYLDCVMIKRDSCMASFNQKEQHRRDGDRQVLDLQ
ncbi:CsgG/HfaB family protein [Rhodanobacter sp. C03]|uniref:CsgG/HfaB family protein n=1 Tax=Rhodanobacter sp. C03 TaxID=1945858 RepID=UPI0009873DB3|nr:CsgG/HfaB family protein [Rhodanobacter sp. C03]OOG56656.1 penicillin-binding protein activator LpoB [Rhodanobacter sp. C03]